LVAVRFVATALVVVELPTMRLVMLASVATREAKNPLVLVLFVDEELVAMIVPPVTFVAERLLVTVLPETVMFVAEALVRVVWPDAERLFVVTFVATAFVVVLFVNVASVAVRLVNDGVLEKLMVLPLHERLAPRVMRDDGVAKNDAHSDDEAVSGIEYPDAVVRLKVCTPVPVFVLIESESPPDVEVANDCVAAAEPLRVVILPPAPPASVPQ
jgi:hypothetical protein